MAGDSGESTRELYETTTWAVALICAVMIIISLSIEKGLHHIGDTQLGSLFLLGPNFLLSFLVYFNVFLSSHLLQFYFGGHFVFFSLSVTDHTHSTNQRHSPCRRLVQLSRALTAISRHNFPLSSWLCWCALSCVCVCFSFLSLFP